jgi:eukaryotic-like serine/threonine-protein kinase
MSLPSGTRVGPYEVTAFIGAGGMGEVYRATDTNLGREVALKMLPAEVAADAARLSRFRREAQLLAALNHPGIAGIHGLEVSEGTPFLVLELVEGEDLAQRLARGPIPPDEAIDIARRVAEALEEAHEHGIVHRDLKPANVKIAPDGKVKVLDFGLAKALGAGAGSGAGAVSSAGFDLSRSPTLVQSGTRAGVILGTAAYMAPEQARGRDVDRRADIWAFGAVLWEMLTGRPLFGGETLSDVLAAVLTREPDWSALPAGTPATVVGLLRRCLERDARRRLQAIGEARIALERAAAGEPTAGTTHAPEATRPAIAGRRWWAAAIALVAAGAGAGAMLLLRPPPQAPTARAGTIAFAFDPPAGHHFVGGMALSRDGRSLAFALRDPAGQIALWVRDLDAVEPRRIAGTDGARFPFWAPDGRRLGFFASGELKTIDLIGGAVKGLARTLGAPDARGGAWGADDVILFTPGFTTEILQVNASGGTPQPATHFDAARKDGSHRWPSFMPDGKRFLFYASLGSGTEPGEVRLGTIGSTETHSLTAAHSQGVFVPPRTLLFVTGQSLVAQQIDVDRPGLVGEPASLGVALPGSVGISGFRCLAAAENGTVAWRQILGGVSQLVWVDRQGHDLGTAVDDGGWHYMPRLSPDGRRIAISHYEDGPDHGDIHVHDPERHLDTRVTFDDLDDQNAIWSPDGRMLAAAVASGVGRGIYRLDPTHPGERRLWRSEDRPLFPEDWFPDGSLLITIMATNSRPDVYRLPSGENAEPVPVVAGPFSEGEPSLTPDGRWLAYVGDSTGREEVYVRALATGEEWRVSQEGGNSPCWRRDGRELYFLDPRGWIVAVPTTLTTGFTMGPPTPLFVGLLEDATGRQYDVSPDGRRFLLNRRKDTGERPVVVSTVLPTPPRHD